MTACLSRVFLLPLLVLLLGSGTASARDSYGIAQLHIKEFVVDKSGDVRITFNPMAETVWFCPGANAKVTPKGVELTFGRAWYTKRPKVDYPAVAVKGEGQVVTIPAKGKPVFVRDGKKLVKLEAAVNWK